jgi:ribokinase
MNSRASAGHGGRIETSDEGRSGIASTVLGRRDRADRVAAVDVVTVGDVMLDVRVDADALEEGGDVHGRVLVRPGGSACNAAVWAAEAGARARVHGRVGTDTAGALIRDELMHRGVEPALAIDAEADTGAMLVVHEPGERSMVADRGANGHLSPDDLPETLEATAVLVSGYTLLFEPTFAAGRRALERAAARFVAVDGASWPMLRTFGAERFFETTKLVNTIFVNDREAEVLTGRRGEAAADVLGERFTVVCVKLGEAGAVMSWEGLVIRTAGVPVSELDSSGAGDAFDGVLLAQLAAGRSPGDALQAACRAGAAVAASYETWPERRT